MAGSGSYQQRALANIIGNSHHLWPFEHMATAMSVKGTSTPQARHSSSIPPDALSCSTSGKDVVTLLVRICASEDNSWGVPGSMH
jgi:hypothetical protein